MSIKAVWKEVFPAICMPLCPDYSVNEPELRRYVKWMADFKGVGGIVCNGHASEVTTFSRDERKEITRIIADEVGDRMPVISGINCEGTMEAVRHGLDAKEAGASALMIQPSHMWLRSGVNKETAVSFVRDIAEGTGMDLAIQLYSKSSRAFYPLETLLGMSKIPNVKAIKLGTRNDAVYERDIRALREQAPHLALFSCHDESLVTSLYQDLDGALVGFAGCVPELILETWDAMKAGDFYGVRDCDTRLFNICKAVYGVDDLSGEAHARAKEVLHQRGIISSGLARRPVLPLTQQEKDSIALAIAKSSITQITLK